MRDYSAMRQVLAIAAKADGALAFDDFLRVEPRNRMPGELKRLCCDGLLDGEVEFDRFGVCKVCDVRGLTSEGAEFYRLVENDDVWAIILSTLKRVGIDVSYPLLKEVCKEIVKRYVVSFIPDI